MHTDHPTVELYFVYNSMFWRLRVYKEQETFARRILETLVAAEEVELLESDVEDYLEMDTSTLMELVGVAIPVLFENIVSINLGIPT